MRQFVVPAALASCLSLCGCSDLGPSCGAAQARTAVLQTVLVTPTAGEDVRIDRINTIRTNYATGEVLCTAVVVARDSMAHEQRFTVGFNVQYDKLKQLQVSVYGVH